MQSACAQILVSSHRTDDRMMSRSHDPSLLNRPNNGKHKQTRSRPRPLGFKSLLQSSGVLAITSAVALGQVIGEDICGCSPSTYQISLDFSLTCPPANVMIGDAVDNVSCLISPFGSGDTTDLLPNQVNQIQILELGQDMSVLVRQTVDGEFLEDYVFDYVSITNEPEGISGSQDIPRGLQISLIGENASGQALISVFIITFTNRCDAYPVLVENESAGWAVFTQLSPPDASLCPIIATTEAPVAINTPPTPAPTRNPTKSPTTTIPPAPTLGPTGGMSMSMSMNLGALRVLDELLDGEYGRD